MDDDWVVKGAVALLARDIGVRGSYIGQQEWERFHIDLVGSDLRMIGEPDDVPPIARVDLPELRQNGYRAYPLVGYSDPCGLRQGGEVSRCR
jgi:hypothetical protein